MRKCAGALESKKRIGMVAGPTLRGFPYLQARMLRLGVGPARSDGHARVATANGLRRLTSGYDRTGRDDGFGADGHSGADKALCTDPGSIFN